MGDMADWMEEQADRQEWEEGIIFCTGCQREVFARLTTGKEMYPHRSDLATMPFWVCDTDRAFVGCHKGSTTPLGFLATPEVKKWRKIIHGILDPLWQARRIKRGQAYAYISHRLGRTYHTAEIYSVEEAKQIYAIVLKLKESLDPGPCNK